jgi:hypothetical protein
MQKEVMVLRSLWFITIVNSAHILGACLADSSLLGICLAVAWRAKPLIVSAAKRGLRVLADSEFARSILM